VYLDSDVTLSCSEAMHEHGLPEMIVVSADGDNDMDDRNGVKEQTNNTLANLSDIQSPQSTDDDTNNSQLY